jgi:plasmid maintenance system killer protein
MLTKRSFNKCKALKRIYEGDASKIHPDHIATVEDILAIMKAGSCLDDLSQPEFGLHPWGGSKKGKAKIWSLDVNGNFRVLFKLDQETGAFYDLDYGDFH